VKGNSHLESPSDAAATDCRLKGEEPMTSKPSVLVKIAKAVLAGLVGAAALLSGATHAQSQQLSVKNIVLVHGAFADGSSWAKVIPILEQRGFHVVAVQNPLTSLSDDVNATRRSIAMQDGPVILVGHSWGGAVITEAGDDPKVVALVYVAAFVPDVGRSANDTSAPFGPTPGQTAIKVDSQHFAWMSEEGILNSFADGLPMAERRIVLAVQGQIYGPMFDEKLTHAAWISKPSWHVIATKDHTLSPAMEEAGAKKAHGVAISLPTCHLAMLQEPQQVADLITEAAKGAAKGATASPAR
jgi:pimeloyl-ACP methyl ester carboxylesterase